ncbi:hypothetical protein M422DRAFT_260968 [Sphaerobolus stellatus SS14]|uniref:Uncharacterized protein n=1 Tax=Sphaerobolus stellatus (strain SS14) TaxID=990650 RepID=A0A0C9VG81_SPHS4|nr:hypothetical protein M422DRAFT_260968 [Sphaerobolus stellatus SS14]
MHFSLGRMYTNSVVATLNARQHLRNMMLSGGTGIAIPNQREQHGFSFTTPSVNGSTTRGTAGNFDFDTKETINIYATNVYSEAGSKPRTISEEEENMELQILPPIGKAV